MRPPTSTDYDISAFLSAVQREKKTIRYKKRAVIFSQGEPSDSIFYIESGALKLSVVSPDGKEAIITITDGGTVFGENCISSGRPVRFHSAVALTEARLVKIERSTVLRVLNEGGRPAISFVSFLMKQNARLLEDLANRLVGSTELNLVRVVSSLTPLQNPQRNHALPQITQQTIAEMIGITRQRVNVLMNRYGLTHASIEPKNKAPVSIEAGYRNSRASAAVRREAFRK